MQRYNVLNGASLGPAIQSPKGYEGPEVLELALHDGGTFLRAINHGTANPDLSRASTWTNLQSVRGAGPERLTPELTLMAEGAIVSSPAGSVTRKLDADTLTYQWAAETAHGKWQLEVQSGCLWDEGGQVRPHLRHTLRFTSPGNQPKTVSSGKSSASARLLDGGELLLQTDQGLLQLAASNPELATARRLPSGLILAPALQARRCFSP